MNIFVRPNGKGNGADVFIDPENEYIRLVNKAKTTSGSDNKLLADRQDDKKFVGDVIHAGGSIGQGLKEVVVFKNITQPDLWAGYNLKSFLGTKRHLNSPVLVKNGVTSEKADVLAESRK